MNTKFDLIIIGAGLVGTSLAIALQHQGLRIGLLETRTPAKKTADSRPLALTFGSQQILHSWGIWSQLVEVSSPIQAIHISERGHLGGLYFRAHEHKVPALGYVVPFAHLHQALNQQAAQQAGVELVYIQEWHNLSCNETGAHVEFTRVDGQRDCWHAALLVGADGAKSTTRQWLNIPIKEQDHDEMAMVIHLALTHPHQQSAYERFTKDGVLAVLPLADPLRVRLVWTMDKNHYENLYPLSDTQLANEIQKHFGEYLGSLQIVSREHSYPLRTIIAPTPIQSSFIAFGDAAHTIYPLAAQGFNLSLRDCQGLSRELIKARQQGLRLGDFSVLSRYQEKRQADQKFVFGFTQGIRQTFGLQVPFLGKARGLGLMMTDLISPLKNRLARQLMGLNIL